jgi:protocatechuate 3,4-dioxygenase beta subunit
VNNGPTTSLVIQLRPEGFIRGRVTDSQGTGLGNARVRVFDSAGVSLSATWSVRTDETGDFGIDSLAPGTYMIGARVGDALGQRVHVEVEEGKTTQAAVLFP